MGFAATTKAYTCGSPQQNGLVPYFLIVEERRRLLLPSGAELLLTAALPLESLLVGLQHQMVYLFDTVLTTQNSHGFRKSRTEVSSIDPQAYKEHIIENAFSLPHHSSEVPQSWQAVWYYGTAAQ